MARCRRFIFLLLYLFRIGQQRLCRRSLPLRGRSPDVGLAAAGYAARAQDARPSSPSGRHDAPTTHLLLAQPMYLNLEFEPDENTSAVARTLPGGGAADDGDSNSWLPAGGLYYVHPVSDKLALGLAVTGYFGLSLDYDDDWVGRTTCGDPAGGRHPADVAWRVNDWLSVVAAIYGMLEEKMAVNNIDQSLPDGELLLTRMVGAVQPRCCSNREGDAVRPHLPVGGDTTSRPRRVRSLGQGADDSYEPWADQCQA
jgi:hypothetical protein